MERNALLAIRGRCGAVCPIGHKGALRCNMYYWPLWGAAVHCVLLAAIGRYGAIYTATTRGRCGALCPIGHYGALWCTVSYWPVEGAVVHCVLLATRGRCGALCPIGHYGAL